MSPRTVVVITASLRPEGSDQDDISWGCAVCRIVDPEDRGNTGRICGNPSDLVPRRVVRVMALHRGSQSARELAFHGTADTHGADAIGLNPLSPDLYHAVRACPVHPTPHITSYANAPLRSCAKIQMPRRGAIQGLCRGDERISVHTQGPFEPLRQDRRAREEHCARGERQRCRNKEYVTVTVSHISFRLVIQTTEILVSWRMETAWST
jgi:hypothetical protein